MKKFVYSCLTVTLAVFAVVFMAVFSSAAEYEEVKFSNMCEVCGDANGDGKVNVADARTVLRIAVQFEKADRQKSAALDLDCDNDIDTSDARLVLRIAVHLDGRPAHVASDLMAVITPATCSEAGDSAHICRFCGRTFNHIRVPQSNHISAGKEIIQKATCSQKGIYRTVCKFCGKIMEEGTIETTEHEWEGTTVTCLNPENSTLACKVCGAKKQIVTQSPGYHTWETVITKEATCTETGVQRKQCTVCGVYSDEADDTVILPSKGGHRSGDWTVLSVASCVSEGKSVRVCTVCGEVTAERTIEMLDHTQKEGSYVVDTEPTADTEGRAHYTCSVCGQFVYETLPKTGE